MAKIKTFKTFTSYVKIHLVETFPDCIIDVKTVKKDIGYQTGIVICPKGTTFAPIIYLNSYFAMLRAGTPLPDILCEIVNDCKAKLGESVNVNLDDIKDFASVKNKICFKLINKKLNSELLSTLPHRDYFNDMSVIYYINLSFTDEEEYLYTVKITNNIAKLWNIDEAQLYELARRNSPRLEKCYIKPLCDTIKEMTGRQNANNREHISGKNFDMVLATNERFPMYVASSRNRIIGAAVILYDKLLQSVSRYIGSFFILLASIYEAIFLPFPAEREDSEQISQMVKSVNAEVVCEEDILSENCLYYDSKSHKLTLIE